jgi:Fur family ferric uptake transcriptional regulator
VPPGREPGPDVGYRREPVRPEQEQSIVEQHLRKSGFRWTNQRALIVRMALATHEHFTAEELLELCRRHDPKVSRATVYRTLGVLEEAGFVEGLDTGDGGRRFEHVIGHEHHDHMVCLECGRILEFRDDELERRQEAAAKRLGFRIARHSLRIYGTCRDCSRQRRSG